MHQLSDDAEPTPPQNLDVIFAKAEPSPQREGLPAGFRMRADAHYVEQLDSPVSPTLRAVDVDAIEMTATESAAPPAALVESVRAHGVLQPLLVQQRGRAGRYRLISGHQRLAAARSAGLDQVPCVIHAVGDAKALELAAAAKVALRAPAPEPVAREWQPDVKAAATAGGTTALGAVLRSIASAGQLLAAPSSLTRDTAAQLLGVECQRALRLLNVVQILGGDYVLWRTALAPADLLGRLRDSLEHEFRVGGLQRSLRIDVEPGLVVHGSEELLLTGIVSAVAALNGVAVAPGPRQFEIAAARGANGTVVLVVRERGLCIPQRWAERAFDEPWPVPDSAAGFAMLQAVREVATAHGGSATVRSGDDATEVCLTLAAGR